VKISNSTLIASSIPLEIYSSLSLIYLYNAQATITTSHITFGTEVYQIVSPADVELRHTYITCKQATIQYSNTTVTKKDDVSLVECDRCSIVYINQTLDEEDPSSLYCEKHPSSNSATKITLIVCLCVGVPLLVVIIVVIVIKRYRHKKQKDSDDTPETTNNNNNNTEIPLQEFNVSSLTTYNYNNILPPSPNNYDAYYPTTTGINIIPDDQCSSSTTTNNNNNIIPLD